MEQRYQAVEVRAAAPVVERAQRFGASRQRCTGGLTVWARTSGEEVTGTKGYSVGDTTGYEG
jgi:hypothetical protein